MKLFSIGCRIVSSRGFRNQSGEGGGEDVLTTCKVIDTCMLVSGIFKQLTTFVVTPDVEGSVFYFRWRVWRKHQSKLYWAWRLVSVWENEPKLKDTTVNHFALRREIDITDRLKSIYVRTVSQRNNTPEPYGLLLYLLFQSPGMTAFPSVFP